MIAVPPPFVIPPPIRALLLAIMLLLSVSVPRFRIPPPESARPLRMVTRERLTFAAALETVTTVPTPPPSMMVVEAAEPRIFRLMLMVKFSVYVAAATLIESPEAAKELAWLTVLQAVVGDVQVLLLLPLTPLTYHVVLAIAVEVRATNTAANRKLVSSLSFMIFSFSSRHLALTKHVGFHGNWRDANRKMHLQMPGFGATRQTAPI